MRRKWQVIGRPTSRGRPAGALMDMPSRLTLRLAVERWPIAGSFAISRGSKTEAVVVVAELGAGKARGRGECVPYARYGETVATVSAAIEGLRPEIGARVDHPGALGSLDVDRRAETFIPGIARLADFAIAPDHRHAERGSGAEKSHPQLRVES